MSELTADVVVVGFGGAGAVAAIEAHDAGASVILLEKMEDGGGSTQVAGGSIRVILDPEKAAKHFHALTFGATPLPLLRLFADRVAEVPDWLRAHGGIVDKRPENVEHFPRPGHSTAFPGFEGADGVDGRMRVRAANGEAGGQSLWNLLLKNVESRNIKVLYNTRGKRLIRNASGEVAGVVATTSGGEVTVRAKRAVILTCGGFAYDPEMQRQFLGIEVPSLAPPGRNTGDGIRMAQDVGADLWHMTSVAAAFGYKVPGHDAAFYTRITTTGFFVVDQTGNRYVNETAVETHSGMLATFVIDPVDGRYLRMPSYLIFDEATRTAGPIAVTTISYNRKFGWSTDNSEEIKKGWIKAGATLAALAGELGIPAAQLEQTAARYEAACAGGGDAFGRERSSMSPLGKPPYYGIPLWPALFNTQGGPRRNERGQIVDVFGNAIPRLYSAGELGSIWGFLYPGAGNISEGIVFGRISGRNAAAETPIR